MNMGPDNAGVLQLYWTRGGGYYIGMSSVAIILFSLRAGLILFVGILDTGASESIANRNIKLLSGLALREYTPNGVRLSDGTEFDVDLVVLATG